MADPALKIDHHQMTIDCYNQQAPDFGKRFLSLDIWVKEDDTPDRKGRNWINGLVMS